jgi:transposase
MNESEHNIRRTAIHLIRSGKSPTEAAQEVGRSRAWVYKWWKRYRTGGWQALQGTSRAPKRQARKLSEETYQAIRLARSELEAEATQPGKLSYIQSQAVRARLLKKGVTSLPSESSIEREIRRAGMTHPRKTAEKPKVDYPHLHPVRPHQLVQIDIVPHYLPGGPCVSCFNAVDVASRYPTGQQFTSKRSEDAASFITQVWRELGIPVYTQVDNEGCFSGGFTHPGVIGRVVRLGLLVGTEMVFSPIRNPESNGTVERFHQDYSKNVWRKIELTNLLDVQWHSTNFFENYRHSQHHSALKGCSPTDLHFAKPFHRLPVDFKLPDKLPITAGQAHFMRLVDQQRQVMVLNINWDVPLASPDQGVWATLKFTPRGAMLRIYDTAPDAQKRTCLVEYPFPLKEPVQPLGTAFRRPIETSQPPLFKRATTLIQQVAQWMSTM